MDTAKLIRGVMGGDPHLLARAITLVENRLEGYQQILKKVQSVKTKPLKIGISGPPGSGKSTLVDKLIAEFRKKNGRIGVIAVDPTSPLSGGALLVDRIKMNRFGTDPEVFIRSVASRGKLGGLNPTIFEIVQLLAAAGKDVIIIETVGVGQNEVDIVNIADVVALVLTPYSGDEMQILKAGIIEIADVFVINKADLGGAEKKEMEIKNYFSLSEKVPEIVVTSAINDTGTAVLVKKLLSVHQSYGQEIQTKKEKFKEELILKIIQEKIREHIKKESRFYRLISKGGRGDPFKIADEILAELLREKR